MKIAVSGVRLGRALPSTLNISINYFRPVSVKYLITVMVAIVERDSTYGNMNWDSTTIVAANGLLKMFHSFVFICHL